MTSKLRALERDALRYFLGKAVAGIGLLASTVIVTRSLSEADYATFAVWTAVAMWCAMAASGWLQASVRRQYAEAQQGDGRFAAFLATVRAATRTGGAAAAIVTAILAIAFADLPLVAAAALGAYAITSVVFMNATAMSQAALASARVALSDVVRTFTLLAVLAIGLAMGGLDLEIATFAWAIAFVAGYLALPRARASGEPVRPQGAVLADLARYGGPMGAWFAASFGNTVVGRAVLESTSSATAVAEFSALQDLVNKVGTLLFASIVSAMHTNSMAAVARQDDAEVRSTVARSLGLMAALAVPCFAVAILAQDLALALLFGSGWATASSPWLATTLVAGMVLCNVAMAAHQHLEIARRTWTMAIVMAIAFAANAALSYVLTPTLAADGAALSYLAAMLVYTALTLAMRPRAT